MQPDDIAQGFSNHYVPLPRRERPSEPAQQIVADIEDFACALSQKITWAAQMFVDEARPGFFGAHEWMRFWSRRLGTSRVRVDEVSLKYLQGDEAQVEVSYAIFGRFNGNDYWPRDWVSRRESLKLHLREVRSPGLSASHRLWGIVYEENEGMTGLSEEEWNRDPYSLRKAAFFLRQPPGIIARIRCDESLERLRSLSYAVGYLVEQYGSFAFDPEFLHAALKSSIESTTVSPRCFRVPGLKEKYSFNTRLCRLSRADVAEPERTILFYEGRDEQPMFRYNGKAALCTVGSTLLPKSREQVEAFKWEP